MAHPSVTLLPLSGNRSSSNEPSVLWPYHSTDLPVLTQTTRPAVFTHLFAVSCVFGHQHRPSTHSLLQHSCWCLHTHTFPFHTPSTLTLIFPLQTSTIISTKGRIPITNHMKADSKF